MARQQRGISRAGVTCGVHLHSMRLLLSGIAVLWLLGLHGIVAADAVQLVRVSSGMKVTETLGQRLRLTLITPVPCWLFVPCRRPMSGWERTAGQCVCRKAFGASTMRCDGRTINAECIRLPRVVYLCQKKRSGCCWLCKDWQGFVQQDAASAADGQ